MKLRLRCRFLNAGAENEPSGAFTGIVVMVSRRLCQDVLVW